MKATMPPRISCLIDEPRAVISKNLYKRPGLSDAVFTVVVWSLSAIEMGPLDLFDLVSLRLRCHRLCALNVRIGIYRLHREPRFRIPHTYFYSIVIACSEGETVPNITSSHGSRLTDPIQSCDTAKPLLSDEDGRGSTWRWRWDLNPL